MKKPYFHVLVFSSALLASAATLVSALPNDPSGQAHVSARASDAAQLQEITNIVESIRRSMRSVTANPKARVAHFTDHQFDALIRGLNDSSEGVRRRSLEGLSLIALSAKRSRNSSTSDTNELAKFERAKQPLLTLMSDRNADIRTGAIRIFALLFPVPPELQEQWITTVDSERSLVRKELLLAALLAAEQPSPATVALALRLLRDAEFGSTAATLVLAHMNPPPPEALSSMVAEFSRSADAGRRDLLARGIIKFGADAHRYLPLLREMAANEKDPTVQRNLARAISALGSS